MSDIKIKKDPRTLKPQKFLRWSPMLDFPKGMSREMVQKGPIRYSLHAMRDRLDERGLPILSKFDSRGFNLSECIHDYGGLLKKHPNATLLEHVRPYLIHIDTTIDPVTKEDVFQCAAWRFTILSEPRFVRGRMRDVKVDMTVVVNEHNQVVTAIITDKDDYTFHNKQEYASHESRERLLRELLLEQTKNQLVNGASVGQGFGVNTGSYKPASVSNGGEVSRVDDVEKPVSKVKSSDYSSDFDM
ncbi:hypothetical protein ACTG16_21620 [Aeromonas sp. 23P]|uniref:hypothetical protein n=1 Tax=Aeromonas sp. 23P TaxID=3452716 RepID=UPI003F7AD127